MATFAHIIGWLGVLLLLLAYFLISSKKVSGHGHIYQILNLLGAIGVGINVFYTRSWPALALQIIWASIAMITLLKTKRY